MITAVCHVFLMMSTVSQDRILKAMDVNPKTYVRSKPYKGHYVGNKFLKVFIPMIHIHIPQKDHFAWGHLFAFGFRLGLGFRTCLISSLAHPRCCTAL